MCCNAKITLPSNFSDCLKGGCGAAPACCPMNERRPAGLLLVKSYGSEKPGGHTVGSTLLKSNCFGRLV